MRRRCEPEAIPYLTSATVTEESRKLLRHLARLTRTNPETDRHSFNLADDLKVDQDEIHTSEAELVFAGFIFWDGDNDRRTIRISSRGWKFLGGAPRWISAKTRFRVFVRDNFTCRYCGARSNTPGGLHIDHARAIANGGTSDEENLVTACADCNLGKGADEVRYRIVGS